MRRWTAAGALLALGGACWWRLGSGAGTVTLNWTVKPEALQGADLGFLSGGIGCFPAGVTEVQATLAGQSATFACDDFLDGGASGTFNGVGAGTQTFTLTGFGPVFDPDAGAPVATPLYAATGTIDVAESSENDLPPVALTSNGAPAGSGDVLLLWSFGGQTCAQAGDPLVSVDLDGGRTSAPMPCRADGIDGIRMNGLGATRRGVSLQAAIGGVDYLAAPTIFSNGVTESVLHVDLPGPAATFDLRALSAGLGEAAVLELGFGPDGGDCTTVGVDHIQAALASADADSIVLVWNQTTCVAGLSLFGEAEDGSTFLPPAGEYLAYVQGLSDGGVTYALSAYPIWLDELPAAPGMADAGKISLYFVNLLPVGTPG